jgi:Mn-dependent DtxR family transcriptional regulator
MAGAITESASMASFATLEVRGLFEEWAKAVEEEILGLLKDKESVEPSEIAAKLKISEESALFFIGKMAREGKLKIIEVKI